ncbi:MAG: hypothetical protein R8P61_20640 [Bacteroidia bacterium]|nr:hypothetical protein [Bacteroidia bacterium]
MKKFSLSLVAGFIVNNVVGTLAALFIAKPWVYPMISEFERKPDELEMPFLLTGYFLLTLMMVIVYPYFNLQTSWLKKGAIWGLIAGLMSFVSIYSIISGWSILPPKAMIISGIIDTSSTIATGIVIAFIYRTKPD